MFQIAITTSRFAYVIRTATLNYLKIKTVTRYVTLRTATGIVGNASVVMIVSLTY